MLVRYTIFSSSSEYRALDLFSQEQESKEARSFDHRRAVSNFPPYVHIPPLRVQAALVIYHIYF
jgi:hypothetical protein